MFKFSEGVQWEANLVPGSSWVGGFWGGGILGFSWGGGRRVFFDVLDMRVWRKREDYLG